MLPLIFIGSFAFIVIMIIISNYNKLNTAKNQISNAQSSLDALFIKRSDLIPNLVAVVKQYMGFEKDTLEKITAMRKNNVINAYTEDDASGKAMKQLMVQVENYPELKTNTQFTNLQYSWNEAEEQISAGRRFLSSSITDYNNAVTTFPGNVLAGMFNFKKFEWQKATAAQQENVNAGELFK